ncbi:unnamed protein product [Polarella glacialis]|uniref:RanBP2-type domain-containing protein n=1 Tax=Polarella glacialis TaxID=89957 RepID=A0A813JV17_POLGL|nr:unnamed protein product [Polarella glacialis]CAE8687762.1 unnamed protein product [Polarella glacialis]
MGREKEKKREKRGRRREPSYRDRRCCPRRRLLAAMPAAGEYSDYSYSPSPVRKKRSSKRRRDESRSPSRRRGGGRRGGGRKGGGNSKLEKFIDENELKEATAMKLRDAPADVAEDVMEQGFNVIDNARNADAVVVTRLRKAQDGGGKSAPPPRRDGSRPRSGSRERRDPPGAVTFKDGDWYCSKCTGMNFARRQDCFKCSTPRGRSGSGSRPRSRKRSRS